MKFSDLPALRSELHDLFSRADSIERRYSDGLITDEGDKTSYKSILAEIQTKQAEESSIQERMTERDLVTKGLQSYGQPTGGTSGPGVPDARQPQQTLGQMFMGSEPFQTAMKATNNFASAKLPEFGLAIEGLSLLDVLQRKDNLVYTGTGDPGTGIGLQEPFESRIRLPGIMPILRNPLTFLETVPRIPTSEELIEWVKESSFTNGATMIGEATAITGTTGLKPSSTMAFTVETTTVKDLAHWFAITNKMLRNSGAMRGMIDTRLLLGLDLLLEDQIMNGSGTGNNLLGLLTAATGIQVRAQGGDNIPDAIHKAMTAVRVTGFANPSDLFMNPLDWEKVRLLRDASGGTSTTGSYLWGSPSTAGPLTMWGVPVKLTSQLAQGTVLLGDFNQCTLFDRMRSNITVGRVNDQFIRNMQTILAEAAVAFVCWRPDAFCKITGVS